MRQAGHLTSLILAKHLVQPFSIMYSETVGRREYHGMAFIVTDICKSMAFVEGMASAERVSIRQVLIFWVELKDSVFQYIIIEVRLRSIGNNAYFNIDRESKRVAIYQLTAKYHKFHLLCTIIQHSVMYGAQQYWIYFTVFVASFQKKWRTNHSFLVTPETHNGFFPS